MSKLLPAPVPSSTQAMRICPGCRVRPMAFFRKGWTKCSPCRHASINRTEANRRYRARHPEKVQARNAVTHAIERERIAPAKELPCIDCGRPAARYDHFKGYSRLHWLDVQPVCTLCCARREKARAGLKGRAS